MHQQKIGTDQREKIKGIQEGIETGKFEDGDPELVSLDRVPPADLEPVRLEVMQPARSLMIHQE